MGVFKRVSDHCVLTKSKELTPTAATLTFIHKPYNHSWLLAKQLRQSWKRSLPIFATGFGSTGGSNGEN